MLKDYDLTISYHPGKANVVADALSRKSSGNLATLITSQRHILEDMEKLSLEVRMQSAGSHIAALVVQPSLIERIKVSQASDP